MKAFISTTGATAPKESSAAPNAPAVPLASPRRKRRSFFPWRSARRALGTWPLAAFLIGTFLPPATADVGRWYSFTDMNRVTSLASHGGFVYAGTPGGVRRIDLGNPAQPAQRDFNNLDGLTDPWITSLISDDAGSLWAVARSGYLYLLDRTGSRWTTHGASYAAQQWLMNERAALTAGPHIFLGSQKGLALFDTRVMASQMTLTRFGAQADLAVLSLLRRDDTLFVGTPDGVYRARIHFADPLNPPNQTDYDNPADPNQWSRVTFPDDSARRYNHLAIVNDTLATFGPGTLLRQGDLVVRAFAGDTLAIGNQTYPDWPDYVTALVTEGHVVVGGDSGLALPGNPGEPAGAATIPPLRSFPRDTIASIGAYNNFVWGHAQSGIKYLDIHNGQVTAYYSPVSVNAPGAQEELYYRFLRNTAVSSLNDAYFGSWGGGLVRRRSNGMNEAWRNTTSTEFPSCLTAADPASSFTAVSALSQPRPQSGLSGLFFTVYLTDQTFQLAYFDTTAGIPLCPPTGLSLSAGMPHAVHLFSDTLLGVASDQGVLLMKVRQESTGPRFEDINLWTLPGSSSAPAWGLATDAWNRPWAIIGDQLAFLDSLDQSTSRKLTPIDNFIGVDCKNLESDPAGKLWVGCSNGLFHVTTDAAGQLAAVRRYGVHDGLPSLFIYDVTIDQANGRVWVATDRGVAMLESSSQPRRQSGELSLITPYPNPLRPHHRHMVFDKLPPNSTVRIHGPGGQVIRIFRPGDLKGGEAQWDGRNENGRPVAPGVYHFSVVTGGSVQRGTVVVAR